MKMIVDPMTGMAGDMFVAALIAAGAPTDKTKEVMVAAGRLLGEASIDVRQIRKAAIAGIQISCWYQPVRNSIKADEVGEMLQRLVKLFSIEDDYRQFAENALLILREAEKRAHQAIHHSHHTTHDETTHHDEVFLHEAQDILVDIAGSAFALMTLGISLKEVTCLSPVFTGGGTVTFSHGRHPVPAPATRQIIDRWKIPAASGPVDRELLTPTGAAILSSLKPHYIERTDDRVDPAVKGTQGNGFGTFEFGKETNLENALRVYLSES